MTEDIRRTEDPQNEGFAFAQPDSNEDAIEVHLEPEEFDCDLPSNPEEALDSESSSSYYARVPWWWSPARWTLFYSLLFLVCTAIVPSADLVVKAMNLLAFSTCLVVLSCCVLVPSSQSRKPSWQLVLSMVYVIGLSLVMAGAILPATTTNWMASAYHSIRPCGAMEQVLHQLEHESTLTGIISYQQESRPLQAQGLSNGYLKRLARALETHFERFSRNESEQFKYIQDLNLIANIFDDRGVKHVLAALEHPHAYTTSLLLGRNTLIGDETALGLANLVASGGGNNQNLTWLALGGTAITRNGIGSLYKALGTRPFSLLGFDYTYRPSWSQRILPLRTNPIADSFPQLHQASLLKELSLTGNRLEDEEMLELTKSILQTNITMLGLTNNRLSPRGIRDLLPLTKHLQKLELSMNRGIGDEGAILLANALKSNDTTIETLTLVECDITQTGADAFRSIFPENTKLKHLLLSHKDNGRIRAETLQSIKEATAANWDRSKRH